ncbi:MAG: glycosyltransferase family 4 protein [Candidatus Acidiferrales bacterium]
MRILLLSTTIPYPANNGVKMRSWSVLRTLVDQGHRVTLIAFAEGKEQPDPAIERVCDAVVLIPHRMRSVSSSRDHMGRLWRLFSSVPYGTESLRSPEMADKIASLLRDGAFDVVLSEQTDLLINFPDRSKIPLVIDFHNVDYLILERYIRFERNPAKQLYAWLESSKMRAWERHGCEMAALALACSEHDRAILQTMNPQLPTFVVPNVVDTDSYPTNGEEDPLKILFQGGMDWYPNRDAVQFFALQILPLIRREIPNVRLVVAGRNPPEDFKQRLSGVEGIIFTGTVPDMRTEVASAAVCIVPLRIGSGTRLKILEASAMAKPIVSTRVGAEGLEFVNGPEILIEDDPAAFAGAIAKLLKSPQMRTAMGRAARARAEQQYSLPAMNRAMLAAWTKIRRQA